MSCQNFHTLEQMQISRKYRGSTCPAIKKWPEKGEMWAHAVLSRAREKNSQWVLFFLRRKCAWLIHQLCFILPALSGLDRNDGDVPGAKEARLGRFFSIRQTTFINANLSSTIKSNALCEGQPHYRLCSFPLGIPRSRDSYCWHSGSKQVSPPPVRPLADTLDIP